MKKIVTVSLCLLSMTAFGQRRERKSVPMQAGPASISSDTSYKPAVRSRQSTGTPAASNDATVPQGPGVVQINGSDSRHAAWFVVTNTIPAGSSLVAYISTPSNDPAGFLKLGPISYTQDLTPGTSLVLPAIANFGDFWPAGITTYDVVVNMNGTNTHNAGEIPVKSARTYSDLTTPPAITPLIYSSSESIANRQVILTVSGNFTSDPIKVVLDDLVVPPGAITLSGDGSTVTVNLSQVPGSSLDVQSDFLLTIGQAGYSDTRVFTHVPFNPTSYQPSPSLQ